MQPESDGAAPGGPEQPVTAAPVSSAVAAATDHILFTVRIVIPAFLSVPPR